MAETAIPLVVAAVALPLIGHLYLAVAEPPPAQAAIAMWRRVLAVLTSNSPGVLMIAAIVSLRGVLGEYEAGRFLSPAATQYFSRVGALALSAVTAKIFLVPVAQTFLVGEEGALRVTSFDASLLVFAGLVALVGTAFGAAAAAIKADNDEFV